VDLSTGHRSARLITFGEAGNTGSSEVYAPPDQRPETEKGRTPAVPGPP
jgi:hypothetical protein